jgi:hypothetical protein
MLNASEYLLCVFEEKHFARLHARAHQGVYHYLPSQVNYIIFIELIKIHEQLHDLESKTSMVVKIPTEELQKFPILPIRTGGNLT